MKKHFIPLLFLIISALSNLANDGMAQGICQTIDGQWTQTITDENVTVVRVYTFDKGSCRINFVLDTKDKPEEETYMRLHIVADVDGSYACYDNNLTMTYDKLDLHTPLTKMEIVSKNPDIQAVSKIVFNDKLSREQQREELKKSGIEGFKATVLMGVVSTLSSTKDMILDGVRTGLVGDAEKWKAVTIDGNRLTFTDKNGAEQTFEKK